MKKGIMFTFIAVLALVVSVPSIAEEKKHKLKIYGDVGRYQLIEGPLPVDPKIRGMFRVDTMTGKTWFLVQETGAENIVSWKWLPTSEFPGPMNEMHKLFWEGRGQK